MTRNKSLIDVSDCVKKKKEIMVTFVTGNEEKLAEVKKILADVLPNLTSQNVDCKRVNI